MKREARMLNEKSFDSLVLAIEHFNRISNRGRIESVLILLDRAFELMLKASILHKGGRIREPKARETIGFDKSIRLCLSNAKTRCLTEEQALVIQIINSLRDAAQHYLVELSEQQLYMYAQAGVTLFTEVQKAVFGIDIRDKLPTRVLPVTVDPPKSLAVLIDSEFTEVRQLLKPGSRKKLLATTKLRSLAIIESSVSGLRSQPSERELNKLIGGIKKGTKWNDLFPGVASLNLNTEGTGLNVTIRLTKSEGDPVHLVPEGTPGATVVAIKRVDELSYYSLSLKKISEKLGLTAPKTLALIEHLAIQQDTDAYKEFQIGKSIFKRYSPLALARLKRGLSNVKIEEVWSKYTASRSTS